MKPQVLILLIVLLIAGVLGYWWFKRENAPNGGNGGAGGNEVQLPSPERLAELLATLKRGAAMAENAQNNLSIEEFEQVAAALPTEVAPLRNMAIVRTLAYEKEPTPAMLALLEESLRRWEPLETDRVLYYRVLGTKFAIQRQFALAIDAFRSASELAPEDPSLWFAMYEAANDAFDESIAEQAPDAVAHAYELQQDNIILAVQLARYQVEVQDPSVAQTIDAIEELVQPTRYTLESHLHAGKLEDFFETLRNGIQSGDWPVVSNRLSGLWNVLNASDQRHSDTKRISRHLLEFIATSFSPDVMAEIPTEVRSITSDVDVRFVDGMDDIDLEGIRDVALADVNLDGRLDLCLLTADAFTVQWGTEVAGWEAGPTVSLDGDYTEFVAQDIDNDKEIAFDQTIINLARELSDAAKTADIDFILVGPSGILGLRNDLDPESRDCKLNPVALGTMFDQSTACGGIAAGDFDSDGDLDLLLDTDDGTTMLWNTDQWEFDAQSSETYSLPEGFRWSHADIAEIDRDVDMDIVLSGNDGTLGYLEGLRHHAFRWRELASADDGASGSVSVVDWNGNASWDVLATGVDAITLFPSKTTGRGEIHWQEPVDVADDIAPDGFLTWDYDNDSRTDVLAWNGDGLSLFRGIDETLAPGPEIGDAAWDDIRSVDVGDLDLDGDLDVVVADAAGVRTFLNEGGNANQWIDILFTSEFASGDVGGVGTNRVNNNAVGSLIEVLADGVYQAHIIQGQRTHIGLGNAEDIEIVRATWTNGAPENYLETEPLQVFAERQTIVTSCPYLYTWNGREFVFVTDLLWAAPLGLPDPAGGLIPARHWEYIRIPGEMLAPMDGVYRLQMTEELWEASYLDEVQLIAVDHPANADIFTNEKVGPPSVAEHRIYTVSEPRAPVAAINHRGEDVLGAIATADDHYLVLHRERHMQGYTEDTSLELDLGDFPDDAELVLYLSGWIRPTDANLNVRLQQDESLPGPQAPKLEIPDGQGGWRELIGYMGHPGGKTKTIAVPLPNEFVDDDHRIRITTSMELYWDQIFFTVNEPMIEVRETSLPLVSADLHYRGVSALVPHPHDGPELYDYSRVATDPRFAPMEGMFTKFGDVLELLTSVDDRLVVFACGDEMTLEFEVPDEPLPEGWVRDFVLYNVGWEKDCNTNGVLGRTTEPYPFVGMSAYPYPPDEAPSGPNYQEYLDTWQTREMEHLPYLRFVQRFDRNSPTAENPTIIGDLHP